MTKWADNSGDGCFKDEMLADQEATKVDELVEWDSDEGMEDIEVSVASLIGLLSIELLTLLPSLRAVRLPLP